MTIHDDALAARVKSAREAHGLSQEALAQAVAARGHDFRQQTIYKIEQGQRRIIAGELVSIADALSMTVTDLLGLGADRLPIVSAGARLEEAARSLDSSAIAYARAALAFAQAADARPELHPNDREFAENGLLRQTPGWIASSALGSLEATVARNGVVVGEGYARRLLEAMGADAQHFHRDG